MVYILVAIQLLLLVTQVVLVIKGIRDSSSKLIYLSFVAFTLLIVVYVVFSFDLYIR